MATNESGQAGGNFIVQIEETGGTRSTKVIPSGSSAIQGVRPAPENSGERAQTELLPL
jgi:hypothetical protein